MTDDISKKDKKDWENFISSNEKLPNKDINLKKKILQKTRLIDLHGYNLENANKSIEEIRKFISAKSLKFLSLNGLYVAMGFEKRNDTYPQLTDHHFTGDYPVKIIDELGGDKVTQLSLLSTASNN